MFVNAYKNKIKGWSYYSATVRLRVDEGNNSVFESFSILFVLVFSEVFLLYFVCYSQSRDGEV